MTTLLIRGYDPLEDTVDYGRELIPLVRAKAARRDTAQAAQAARERSSPAGPDYSVPNHGGAA